jgi:hypothetical protein
MESAKPFGFKTIIYDNKFIENLPYYNDHKDIFTKVSFGFAFKAICLYETMKIIDNGDVVFFVDSNHIIQKDPQLFVDIAIKYGIFARNHIWTYYPQKEWTRRDTFINMNCDNEFQWNAEQLQANIIGFCKSDLTMQFITEFKDYSLDYKTMFGENKYKNFDGFKEHRHDQAEYSILVHKYGFPYLNRTQNVELEFIIPELDGITPTNPIDNTYRKEQDRLDNK